MFDEDSYYEAMGFVIRMQVELKGRDLDAWVASELNIAIPKFIQLPKKNPRIRELSREIISRRRAFGFSQSQLARILGRSLCHVSRLELGNVYTTEKPYLAALDVLRRGFNCYHQQAA